MRKKRRQTYVDSSVQGALLRRIFIHWCLFFAVTTVAVVLLQTLLGDPSKSIVDRMRFEMGEFVFIGIVLLALLPVFMLDTVRFSNRFVGPILRIRRYMNGLAKDGNTDHVNFRDNDFWVEMATEYNEIADIVKQQKEEIAQLKAQLEKVEVTS